MEALSPAPPAPLSFQAPPESWRRLFKDLEAGAPEPFAELYDASSRRLFALALWRTGSVEDAQDVVQEVFVRLVKARHELGRIDDPRAWLLKVTHRAAVDVTRRRGRRRETTLEAAPFLAAPAEDTARSLDARKASSLLGKLPANQREAVYLHHFAGCTFSAIGRITGVLTFTAASRYRLGIEKLRRLMEGTP